MLQNPSKSRKLSDESNKDDVDNSESSKSNRLISHGDLSNLYEEVNELQDENEKLVEENVSY